MKNLLNIVGILSFLLIAASCNDVLDNAQPSTAISQNQSLSSPEGIDAIRASLYDRLHGTAYSTLYFLGPDALADNLANRLSATRYGGLVDNNDGSGMGAWGASYNIVNDANLLINAVPDGILDQGTLEQYRGEAMVMRAFAMHQLVKTYGYEPGMAPQTGPGAGFNLGIIIRPTPTLDVSDADYRPRKPVDQVYDFITNDLTNAIDLLSNGDSGSRNYITKAAAEALMARVQLYAGNYSDANSFATDAITDGQDLGAHLAQPDEVPTMFDETVGTNPESIFEISVDPNTETVGGALNNSLAVYTAQSYVALVPTQDLMDLYSENDPRLSWYGPCFDENQGIVKPGCLATYPTISLDTPDGKADGLEVEKWAAERGQYADNYPFFRISEMLLIQAEARLRGNSGDAAAPLNKLREARNESDYNGSDMMQSILNERRREFIAEGQRFFDLKRLGRAIRKAPDQVTVNRQPVPYNDHRILDNIPDQQVSLSQANAPQDSVLVQNPGY